MINSQYFLSITSTFSWLQPDTGEEYSVNSRCNHSIKWSCYWPVWTLLQCSTMVSYWPVWASSLVKAAPRTLPVASPSWLASARTSNRRGQRSQKSSSTPDNSQWISTVREKCQQSPNRSSSCSCSMTRLLPPGKWNPLNLSQTIQGIPNKTRIFLNYRRSMNNLK